MSELLDQAVLRYVQDLPISAHALFPFDYPDSRNQVFLAYARGAILHGEALTHLSDDGHIIFPGFTMRFQ